MLLLGHIYIIENLTLKDNRYVSESKWVNWGNVGLNAGVALVLCCCYAVTCMTEVINCNSMNLTYIDVFSMSKGVNELTN